MGCGSIYEDKLPPVMRAKVRYGAIASKGGL